VAAQFPRILKVRSRHRTASLAEGVEQEQRARCGADPALTFKVSGGKVVGLKYHINDTCPDGHILTEDITFQPITITGGRFS
jgi:hypothetical protein